MPWWGILLIALGSAGVGAFVGIVILLGYLGKAFTW